MLCIILPCWCGFQCQDCSCRGVLKQRVRSWWYVALNCIRNTAVLLAIRVCSFFLFLSYQLHFCASISFTISLCLSASVSLSLSLSLSLCVCLSLSFSFFLWLSHSVCLSISVSISHSLFPFLSTWAITSLANNIEFDIWTMEQRTFLTVTSFF